MELLWRDKHELVDGKDSPGPRQEEAGLSHS